MKSFVMFQDPTISYLQAQLKLRTNWCLPVVSLSSFITTGLKNCDTGGADLRQKRKLDQFEKKLAFPQSSAARKVEIKLSQTISFCQIED